MDHHVFRFATRGQWFVVSIHFVHHFLIHCTLHIEHFLLLILSRLLVVVKLQTKILRKLYYFQKDKYRGDVVMFIENRTNVVIQSVRQKIVITLVALP